MAEIRDRYGRRAAITLSGGGRSRLLDRSALEAALRLGRRLRHQPRLCSAGLARLAGFLPSRADILLWNGRTLRFNTPRDLGAFLNDIYGIVLRDQYCVSGLLGGARVADAGANQGVFTLYALALGARKVHAFEPVPETFAMLKANLALNRAGGRVAAVMAALGARPGRALIRFNTGGEGSAMIGGEDTVNADISYSSRREVPVKTLDAAVAGRLDIIKADVEGYEAEVLRGAAGHIRRHRPALSLAAYHRAGDGRRLRAAVSSIQPGYGFELAGHAEKDLFCRYGA